MLDLLYDYDDLEFFIDEVILCVYYMGYYGVYIKKLNLVLKSWWELVSINKDVVWIYYFFWYGLELYCERWEVVRWKGYFFLLIISGG